MFALPLCFTISKTAGSFIRPPHKQAWLSWSTCRAIYLPSESGWKFRHWSDLKFFRVVLITGRFTFCDCVKIRWRSRKAGSRNFTQLCVCSDFRVITRVLCVYMRGSAKSESYMTAEKHKKTRLNLDKVETGRHLEGQLMTDIITHNSVVEIVLLWISDLCSWLMIPFNNWLWFNLITSR